MSLEKFSVGGWVVVGVSMYVSLLSESFRFGQRLDKHFIRLNFAMARLISHKIKHFIDDT